MTQILASATRVRGIVTRALAIVTRVRGTLTRVLASVHQVPVTVARVIIEFPPDLARTKCTAFPTWHALPGATPDMGGAFVLGRARFSRGGRRGGGGTNRSDKG